jgi:hypothetical protein
MQWILVIVSSLVLFLLAPRARTAGAFFGGTRREQAPGMIALMSSLVISWLFAKSITNAANLGLAFGLIGGVAYAAYYLSFAVAGWVIYRMRRKGGFRSIHDFLSTRFGKGALVLFSVLICFRLFNEVWSNTMVIGTYFGGVGELPYYVAIVVFTVLTLAYSLKGGMASSILTDIIQMALFGVLLVIVLGAIFPRVDYDPAPIVNSGEWTMAAGGNLLLVAILQSFSYPFHDPVLTDRGFLADPKTTLRAFLWATPLGFICILLFSMVGIYGQMAGVSGQAPVEVAKLLGGPILLVMNFIMITSAGQYAGLHLHELRQTYGTGSRFGTATRNHRLLCSRPNQRRPACRSVGRWAMVVLVILGTLPVFMNPAILSATTVSGAMVVGLAPVFCLWHLPAPALSFWLSVGFGLVCGVVYAAGLWPAGWTFTSGKYDQLLAVTVVEMLGCFGLYGLGMLMTPRTSLKGARI